MEPVGPVIDSHKVSDPGALCVTHPGAFHFIFFWRLSMRALFIVLTLALVSVAVLPADARQKAPARAPRATSARAAAVPSAPVNLNSATQAQLEALPGIGPKAAQRIIEYRQKNGQFKKIEDLMNVKGVGEKSFLKLKPYLTVAEKTEHPGASQR